MALRKWPSLLHFLCFIVIALETAHCRRLNVLFVLIDDLRPENPSYNSQSVVTTPNLEKLASNSVQFDNAHASAGLCGPSRASMLSGRKPQSLNYYLHRLKDKRKAVDREITERSANQHIGEYFRSQGYTVRASGKVYHSEKDMYKTFGRANSLFTKTDICSGGRFMCSVDDEDATDTGAVDWVLNQITALEQARKGEKQWFAMIGIRKPHLPYKVPKRFFQELKDEEIPVAAVKSRPGRSIANYVCQSILAYSEVAAVGASTALGAAPFPDPLASKIRKGYYAAVEFVDSLVGKIMDHLEKLHLKDNTVLVVTSDNGWSLGEHGDWCKQSNFDLSTRVPLWIADPLARKRSARVSEVVSLLDMYPTLIDLAGLPQPKVDFLEGSSFAHFLRGGKKDPAFSGEHVFTVSARCVKTNKRPISLFKCARPTDINFIGFSIRTVRWRYTEWRKVQQGEIWNGEPRRIVDWNLDPFERELYDHNFTALSNFDHSENTNLLARTNPPIEVRTIANRLSPLLRKEFETGNDISPTQSPTTPAGNKRGNGFILRGNPGICWKPEYITRKKCSTVQSFGQANRACKRHNARLCSRSEILQSFENPSKCNRASKAAVVTNSSCGEKKFFAIKRLQSGAPKIFCLSKSERYKKGLLVQCCADSCETD